MSSKQKERKKNKLPTKNTQKLEIAETFWYKLANQIHAGQKQHEYMCMSHKIHNDEEKRQKQQRKKCSSDEQTNEMNDSQIFPTLHDFLFPAHIVAMLLTFFNKNKDMPP
jgi:hypothetical protein